jgi:hypothetical protein
MVETNPSLPRGWQIRPTAAIDGRYRVVAGQGLQIVTRPKLYSEFTVRDGGLPESPAEAAPSTKEHPMAKGMNKSNREVRKPKADKTKAPAAQSSPFAARPGSSSGAKGGKKK